MKRYILMLLMILTAVPCIAMTAEVKNVKVSQVGNNAVATYDLVGGAGEQDAEVMVAITIGDEKRTSDKLSLTGDFGKGVKVGKGKKIVWNVMKDFPSGPEGDLSWDVKAVNSQAHNILVLGCRTDDTCEYCNAAMKCTYVPDNYHNYDGIYKIDFSAGTVSGYPASISDEMISWDSEDKEHTQHSAFTINRYTKEYKSVVLFLTGEHIGSRLTYKGTCEPQQEKAF